MQSILTRSEIPAEHRKSEANNTSWAVFSGLVLTTLLFVLSYENDGSGIFLLFSFLTATTCVAFIAFHRPQETLNPAKVFTLLYAASLVYAPVWLLDKRIFRTTYFGNEIAPIMDRTALIVFIGYVGFLLGYALLVKPQRSSKFHPANTGANESIGTRTHFSEFAQTAVEATAFNLAFISAMVGMAFYVVLITKLGGFAWLLGYSGGRADMLADVYGGLFWGVHILFVAYGFYLVSKMRQRPGLCLIIAIIVSALFVPFQGRDLVIAPLFCWLIGYHTLKENISWKSVLISGAVIISLSGLVAAFRNGGNLLLMKDPSAFIAKFSESFTLYFSGVVAENIEQFDSAMIAVCFVEKSQSVLGIYVLTSWLEPIDRAVFGGILPSIYSGVFLDLLVTPEHRGWHTALSPSIAGELWLSFGWLGITLGMFGLGMLFAVFSRWANSWRSQPLLFAAYPFVLYMTTKLIVDGTTHLFRALLIFSAVWCLTRLIKSHSLATVETRRSIV